MSTKDIVFTVGDLDLFATASGDVNPLHVSEDYARRTAYGQRVTHGVLGLLHALSGAPTWRGEIVELSASFTSPMFCGVRYASKVDLDGSRETRVRLLDGRRIGVKATATFCESQLMRATTSVVTPERLSPRTWQPIQLGSGVKVSGVYGASEPALTDLLLATGLKDRGLPRWQVAVLLACSYVIGMELPGRQALFTTLSASFVADVEEDMPTFEYEASVKSFDARFDRAVIGVYLMRAGRILARATMKAFIRSEIPGARSAMVGPKPGLAASVSGIALITGASRGLGASLSTALAELGWTVIGIYRDSNLDAEALRAYVATTSGRFIPLRGDAADAAFWRDTVPRLLAEHSGIDLLVCNAFPPLLPLWIEPEANTRIVEYVTRSVAMTSTPLAHLVEAVAARRGTVMMISSAYVQGDSADWPHYVAAKAAVEGLARVVAAEFPAVRVIVARPPRIRTDFSNAPLAHAEAMLPSSVAESLAAYLGSCRPETGGVEVVDVFEDRQTGGSS